MSRVNIKFVIAIAGAMLLLFGGVAFIAVQQMYKSPEELISRGDAALAEGDFKGAAREYSKAVNKDKTNVVYLDKWRSSVIRDIPDTDVEYNDAYRQFYLGILQRMALLQASNPEPHHQYLGALLDEMQASTTNADAWDSLIQQTETSLQNMDMTVPGAESIRRFRGIATLNKTGFVTLTDSEITNAIADLEAALADDPTDAVAAASIVNLQRERWNQALLQRRSDLVAQREADVAAAIARLDSGFGGTPWAEIVKLQTEFGMGLETETSFDAQIAFIESLEGREQAVFDAFAGTPASETTAQMLFAAFSPNGVIAALNDDAMEIGVGVVDRVIQENPDNPRLKFLRGKLIAETGDIDGAIAAYQELIDSPDLPVSLDGILLKRLRSESTFEQANMKVDSLEPRMEQSERDRVLAEARGFRDALASRETEDNFGVRLIDGKIAYSNRDFDLAVSILQELTRQAEDRNVEVLRLLGGSLAGQGTLGASLTQFEKILQLNGNDVAAMSASADVHRRMGNTTAAVQMVDRALVLAPGNTQLINQRNALLVASGRGGEVDVSSDPALQMLIAANSLVDQTPPDYEAAVDMLDDAIRQFPEDIRLLTTRVEYMARAGRESDAAAEASRLAGLFPDDPRFARMQRLLTAESGEERALAMIDASARTPLQKALARRSYYAAQDQPEKAAEALAEAVAIDPDDSDVLDARFVTAVQAGEFDEARSIANRAGELNADRANGLLFAARLNLAEGNIETARGELEQAVSAAPLVPQAWRLLGQTRMSQGEVVGATDAMARANELAPNDAEIALLYARYLAGGQNYDEALAVVNEALLSNTNNEELTELALSLRSVSGNVSDAIADREALYASDPENNENARRLIAMLISEGRFARAEELLNESDTTGDNATATALLRASWFGEQDRVEEGAAVIQRDIIDGSDNEKTVAGLLAKADFYSRYGETESAVEAMKQASDIDESDVMIAARRMGDYYYGRGQLDLASEQYERVIERSTDEDGIVRKRLAETYLTLDRFDDAERMIDLVEAEFEPDMQTLLLRSSVKAQNGDRSEAAALIERAIELAPNRPEPFMRRAQLDAQDTERERFVLDDIDQALRLRPNMESAHLLKASIFISQGRTEEAIVALVAGIESSPRSRQIRTMLVEQLYAAGRAREALESIEEAIALNPEEPSWHIAAGDLLVRSDDYSESLDYYVQGYELREAPSVAVRIADAALLQERPDPDMAGEYLAKHPEYSDTVMQFVTLRARVEAEKGNDEGAGELGAQAALLCATPQDVRVWYRNIIEIYPDRDDRVSYGQSVEMPENLADTFTIVLASDMIFDPAMHSSVQQDLEAIRPRVIDPQDKVGLLRILSQFYYSQARYEEAVGAYREALLSAPNDLEFNNNLAYTLVKHMNDAEGALAPAELAAQIAPSDGNTLDTLGVVYTRVGRMGQAETTLLRALQNSRGTEHLRAGVLVHLAELMLATDRPADARLYAGQATDILEQSSRARTLYQADYDALMEKLGN